MTDRIRTTFFRIEIVFNSIVAVIRTVRMLANNSGLKETKDFVESTRTIVTPGNTVGSEYMIKLYVTGKQLAKIIEMLECEPNMDGMHLNYVYQCDVAPQFTVLSPNLTVFDPK